MPTFPPMHEILKDLNCSLTFRLAKDGFCVRGYVNNVDLHVLLDSASQYSLIDFDF